MKTPTLIKIALLVTAGIFTQTSSLRAATITADFQSYGGGGIAGKSLNGTSETWQTYTGGNAYLEFYRGGSGIYAGYGDAWNFVDLDNATGNLSISTNIDIGNLNGWLGIGFTSISGGKLDGGGQGSLGLMISSNGTTYSWSTFGNGIVSSATATNLVADDSNLTVTFTYDATANTISGYVGNVALFTGLSSPYSSITGFESAVIQAAGAGYPNLFLENIAITTSPIPEPSSVALMLAAGGIGFALKRHRKSVH